MVLPIDRLLFGGPPPTSILRGRSWGSNLFWSQFSASHRPGSGQLSRRTTSTFDHLLQTEKPHTTPLWRIPSQTEQIVELRSRLPDKQPPLLPFLRTLLQTLPTDFSDDDTPDDSLYHFLCADPAADQNTLASSANALLHFLHLDKSPNPDDPAVKAAAHLVPLITHIKRVLTIPALRLVYDHCGLSELQRLLNHKLRCILCMPVEDRVGHFAKDPWGILSYISCWHTVLRSSLLSGATSLCGVGPSRRGLLDTPPSFCVSKCPQCSCLKSCFLSLRDPCSVFSSRPCNILMLIFGASSLAADVNTLPGGVFPRHRRLTALPGLHLIQSSAKFRHQTLQHQLRLVLRFRSRTTKQQSRTKIIIWHDVINNTLTPHLQL